MQRFQLGPGIYVVRRPSTRWPIVHVAVLVVGNQLGVAAWGDIAARLLEFDSTGMRFEPYNSSNGWILEGRVADHRGAIERINAMLSRPPQSYDLFANNCEHMVTAVATGARSSPQVHAFVGAFAACAFGFLLIRAAVRTA